MSRSVICVVRSVGERTTDACVKALEAQTGQEPEVLGELSFRDAVRRCFTSALESGEPLLLTCDADVLPYAGCVDELLMLDRQVPQNYFQIVGDVDDHLFGRTRNGGLRLYRVDWLERALRLLEHSDSVRPESGLILPMAKKGHPSAYSDAVLGLHAAHQSRSDVYRTAKFFAHKHAQSVAELAALWRTGGPESDFAVALEGSAPGWLTTPLDQMLGFGEEVVHSLTTSSQHYRSQMKLRYSMGCRRHSRVCAGRPILRPSRFMGGSMNFVDVGIPSQPIQSPGC